MIWFGAITVPLIMLGSNNSGTIIADTRDTTNHGMIWTKTIAFRVARFVLFEFKPVHMPNQAKALRLAKTVSIPATDSASITRASGDVKLLTETVAVGDPVVFVTTIE